MPVEKAIKHGDAISSKLFTTFREQISSGFDWTGGVNVNGEPLTHLRFGDYIVLITGTTDQLQTLLTSLYIISLRAGLKK